MGRDQNRPHQLLSAYRPVHNIRSSESSVICLRRIATGSAYKMIWTRVMYAGIFYSDVRVRCDTRPNHFVCTSGRNAHLSVYCEPALCSLPIACFSKVTSPIQRPISFCFLDCFHLQGYDVHGSNPLSSPEISDIRR